MTFLEKRSLLWTFLYYFSRLKFFFVWSRVKGCCNECKAPGDWFAIWLNYRHQINSLWIATISYDTCKAQSALAVYMNIQYMLYIKNTWNINDSFYCCKYCAHIVNMTYSMALELAHLALVALLKGRSQATTCTKQQQSWVGCILSQPRLI